MDEISITQPSKAQYLTADVVTTCDSVHQENNKFSGGWFAELAEYNITVVIVGVAAVLLVAVSVLFFLW